MQIPRNLSAVIVVAALVSCALVRSAAASPAKDPNVRAVEAVLAAFERAVAARDGTALVALLVRPEVQFSRTTDENGTIFSDTGAEFAGELLASTAKLEQHFTDVAITARDGLAVVDAHYRFLVDGSLTNHGREVMILVNTSAGWRIASATWTGAHPPPTH
jgi:hypothetical protein